jgi:hypothetical protein
VSSPPRCWVTEAWITSCSSKLIYDDLVPRKEVVYVMPITSILGKLPLVRTSNTGTIPQKHRAGMSSGCHRYDHSIALADTTPAAGHGGPMHVVNSWALVWSRDM